MNLAISHAPPNPCPESSFLILQIKNLRLREISDLYESRQRVSYGAKIKLLLCKDFDRKPGKGGLLLRLCW